LQNETKALMQQINTDLKQLQNTPVGNDADQVKFKYEKNKKKEFNE
jgi:hypothetical protein